MDTQLVRLDPPYNVIFTTENFFGLHIATLIVVDEVTERIGRRVRKRLRSRSFPVAAPYGKLDGEAWTDTELKDCLLVCRQGETITLRTLKRYMKYCGRISPRLMFISTEVFLDTMRDYNININFTDPVSGKRITNCEVELIFDEGAEGIEDEEGVAEEILTGRTIIDVYSASSSLLYFTTYFFSEDELLDKQNAIAGLNGLRLTYLRALKPFGLKSIKFTTKDKKYQSFVDELNRLKKLDKLQSL